MQITFPQVPPDDIARITKDIKVVNMWADHRDPGQSILQLIVPVEDCEQIIDHFQQRFGNSPGFNIMLMSLEAVIPRPKTETKEKKLPEESKKKNRHQPISTASAAKSCIPT